MTTTKYMFGAMKPLSGGGHLMLMVPYIEKEMNVRTYNAGRTSLGETKTNSDGLGDVSVNFAAPLPKANAGKWMALAKFSLPTGSIKETDQVLTPNSMLMQARLPYTMQLGTGTVDVTPSLKGTFNAGDWQILTGFSFTARMGRNAEDYTYGDEVHVSLGVAREFEMTKARLMLDVKSVGRIVGRDTQITAPTQSAQTGFYGGQRATLTADFKFGDTIGAFFKIPVYEDLNGPQMSLDNMMGVNAKFSF